MNSSNGLCIMKIRSNPKRYKFTMAAKKTQLVKLK